MHFPNKGIRFWGQTWPEFQDFNVDNNVGEIFDYFEVFD
jgi:hypothetical protein